MRRKAESIGDIDSAYDCHSAWFKRCEQTSESVNLFFYRTYTCIVFL